MNYLFQCLLITLPIILSGLFFIFTLKRNYFDWLKIPIDCGLTIRGKRLFGANKTLRGFIIMPIVTFSTVILMSYLIKLFNIDTEIIIFDYNFFESYKALIYGFAYPLGELPNSFIKRQLDIKPGENASRGIKKIIINFFDNADSIISCGFAALLLYGIAFKYVVGAIIIGLLFHFLTDLVMIKIGLKKKA